MPGRKTSAVHPMCETNKSKDSSIPQKAKHRNNWKKLLCCTVDETDECEYIKERDAFACDPNDIFLINLSLRQVARLHMDQKRKVFLEKWNLISRR